MQKDVFEQLAVLKFRVGKVEWLKFQKHLELFVNDSKLLLTLRVPEKEYIIIIMKKVSIAIQNFFFAKRNLKKEAKILHVI